MHIRSSLMSPRGRLRIVILLLATLLLPVLPQTTAAREPFPTPATASPPPPSTTAQAAFAHPMQSLAFEENRGQSDPRVRFLAHAHGYSLFFAPTEIVQTFAPSPQPDDAAPGTETDQAALRFGFAGANPTPTITSEEPLARTASYFFGNDPAEWHGNVPTSAKVRYRDLYPGIDLVWYGNADGQPEYDVIVAPGAEPGRFAFTVTGADDVRLGPENDLVLRTAGGEARQRAPKLYQETNDGRRAVDGGFDLRTDGTVGFRVGAYDPARPLIIDPSPTASTYVGGSGDDQGVAVDTDAQGNIYVAGYTSTPFTPGGGYHSPSGGGKDIFVAKYSAVGLLLSVAFIGGVGDDLALTIRAFGTNGGDVIVGGNTKSTDFPTTAGTVKPNCATGGQQDGFILTLNNALATLKTSTCIGNTSGSTHNSTVNALTLKDSVNFELVFDGTSGGGLNVTAESPPYGGGASDGFVGKISADLTTITNLDYVGGAGLDHVTALAVDASGTIYVTGDTTSSGLGTVGAFQANLTGSTAAFVQKFNASFVKQWGSYLNGPTSSSYGYGIAVGTDGAPVVTGQTLASGFPTMNPLPGQDTSTGIDWGFLTKFSAGGTSLVYSTILNGGTSTTSMSGVAIDANNNAHAIGTTYNGSNFPVTPASALQTTVNGNDAAVIKVSPTGGLLYGTIIGGSVGDIGNGIAVGTGSNPVIAVTGLTNSSTDFPLANAAQATYGGGTTDGFVTVFIIPAAAPTLVSITITPANPFFVPGQKQTCFGHYDCYGTVNFTATGHYSDGSTKDISGDVEWQSDKYGLNEAFFIHGFGGILAVGVAFSFTATITATLGNVSGMTTLFVALPSALPGQQPEGPAAGTNPSAIPASQQAAACQLLLCNPNSLPTTQDRRGGTAPPATGTPSPLPPRR